MKGTSAMLHYRKVDQVLIGLALVILPQVQHLPVWITALVILCGIWRAVSLRRGWRNPRRWALTLVAIVCGLGIFLTYGQLNSQDAGTALLVTMVALKLMELRGRRDALLLVFLGYFLVVTNFLHSQELPMVLWLAPATVWLTMVLLDVARDDAPLPWRYRLRTTALLMLQALPLMLVLFLLFPRLPGPLWGVPSPDDAATTGLSDSMSPGSISGISQSNEVAFRVTFDESAPRQQQMYWRGPVFREFDGQTWRYGDEALREGSISRQPEGLQPLGPAISYRVTLEPSNQHWLMALDMPASIERRNVRYLDGQALATEPVEERERYDAASYPAYRLQIELPEELRQQALHLPNSGNARARALARQWAEEYASTDEIIAAAMRLFNEQPFYYTLEAAVLGDEPVDEFLFDTREGFCEHYASAFAYLMRAAGIPARIVTGYLGTEHNPIGNYHIVRQSNAHAWTEVWQEGMGWVRHDPTAAVAPERIEQGINTALDGGGAAAGEGLMNLRRLMIRLELGRDAINALWDAWVLAYGPERQVEVLERLGLRDANWRSMATTMGVLMVVLLALHYAWIGWQARTLSPDAPSRHYRLFCRRLERIGLTRKPHEGPVDFAARAAAQRPDLAAHIRHITDLYVALRYADCEDESAALHTLQQAVRNFRPPRKAGEQAHPATAS